MLDSPNAITLRLATVFGMSPRMRLDLLVNHFVYAAVKDGYLVIFEKDFKRNFVHIRDVADCLLHCIANARPDGRPALQRRPRRRQPVEGRAGPQGQGVRAQLLHPLRRRRQDPDKRNYIVSNQRLREAGFEARRSLDDGIRELLKGYRMLGRGRFMNV